MKDNLKYPIINILGKDIKIKGYYCPQDCDSKCNVALKESPMLGLYVNINKICNAKCEFCNVHKNMKNIDFDLNKFENVFKQLVKDNIIHKVAITGGETFLSFDIINGILDIVYKYSNDLLVTINTNGTFIDKIKDIHHLEKLYGILLSRHHYLDSVNNEIFGCKTATLEELKKLNKTLPEGLLRLKCTLIKGYIDNIDEAKKYLEMASQIGAKNVGFAVLRPENEFCKEKKVQIDFSKDPEILHVYSHYDGEYCRCNNYIYTAKNFKSVGLYDRKIGKVNSDYCFQLLYNENNLYAGFGKEKII